MTLLLRSRKPRQILLLMSQRLCPQQLTVPPIIPLIIKHNFLYQLPIPISGDDPLFSLHHKAFLDSSATKDKEPCRQEVMHKMVPLELVWLMVGMRYVAP